MVVGRGMAKVSIGSGEPAGLTQQYLVIRERPEGPKAPSLELCRGEGCMSLNVHFPSPSWKPQPSAAYMGT